MLQAGGTYILDTNPTPITAIAFDVAEELTWVGNEQGVVSAFTHPRVEKCCGFVGHDTAVLGVLVEDAGVLSFSAERIRFHQRWGMPVLDMKLAPDFTLETPLNDAARTLSNPAHLILGGPCAAILDLTTGRFVTKAPLSDECTTIAIGRHLCCGHTNGTISLRDPRTLRCETVVNVFASGGVIEDVDVQGNTLVTCGLTTSPMGQLFVDPYLHVYDLRTNQLVSHIRSPFGAVAVRFHPKFSSTVAALSSSGQFQLLDVQGDLSASLVDQLDVMEEVSATTFDISSTGNVWAFGDSAGAMHAWSVGPLETSQVNAFSRPTDMLDDIPEAAPSIIDEGTPFSIIPLPQMARDATTVLLSDYPLAPEDVDPALRTSYAPATLPAHVYARMLVRGPEIWSGANNRGFPRNAPLPQAVDDKLFDPYVRKSRLLFSPRSFSGPTVPDRVDLPQVPASPENAPDTLISFPCDCDPNHDMFFTSSFKVQPSEMPADTAIDSVAEFFHPLGPRRKHQHWNRDDDTQKRENMDHNADHHLNIPKVYAFKEINVAKIDIFDTQHFNHTQFSGLENTEPERFINAWLHVLFFVEPFRNLVMSHICEDPACLACEVGFVFGMLAKAKGDSCHCNNLIRCLRNLPTAAALNIIPKSEESRHAAAPQRVQNFFSFLLDRIEHSIFPGAGARSAWDEGSPAQAAGIQQASSLPSLDLEKARSLPPQIVRDKPNGKNNSHGAVDLIFGLFGRKLQRSLDSEHAASSARVCYAIELRPPGATAQTNAWLPNKPAKKDSFLDTLNDSLNVQTERRGWNNATQGYEYFEQHLVFDTLPNIMTINCPNLGPAHLEHFQAKVEHDGVKPPCWIPLWLTLKYQAQNGGSIIATSQSTVMPTAPTDNLHRVYELTSVICLVNDKVGGKPCSVDAHTVALVKVPLNRLSSEARASRPQVRSMGTKFTPVAVDDERGRWHLFNDFVITDTSVNDALRFDSKWKKPVALVYTCVDFPKMFSHIIYKNPIQLEHYLRCTQQPLKSSKKLEFVPLSKTELETVVATSKSSNRILFAIDAEFIALTEDQFNVTQDGNKFLERAGTLALGRVSVVRGSGEQEGTAAIDDYIATTEDVADYLTRYSGLSAGDLDVHSSSQYVVSLKTTHTKLRFLVDHGCHFIGHGLNKDFRIINLFVPPENVIDTVMLFHLPRQRMLSLRFLAFHVLKLNIQTATHDSIEDAKTALALYRVHERLKSQGRAEEVISALYDIGMATNWEVPPPIESQFNALKLD